MKKLLIHICLIMLCFGCNNQGDSARNLYNKAMQLERQGHIEDANQLYELIIKKYPSTQVAVDVNKMLINKRNNLNLSSDILFNPICQNKQMAAKKQIWLLGIALDDFRLDTGRYPTTDEGLKVLRQKPKGLDDWDGPYLPKPVPKDPWEHPYQYRSPGKHGHYDLMSYGRDGQHGGDGENADIVNWSLGQLFHEKTVGYLAKVETEKNQNSELMPVFFLEPFVVDLADVKDKHCLKMRIKLGLNSDDLLEEVKKKQPQIRDIILTILSSKTTGEINSMEGKFLLRQEIIKRVNTFLVTGTIAKIYLEEFVVQ